MTIETCDKSDDIFIDGRRSDVSGIEAAYYLNTKDMDSLQKSELNVKLKFEEGTTMGLVSDIKFELRKLNLLNVKYYETVEHTHLDYQ
jgi:hypothetical protein